MSTVIFQIQSALIVLLMFFFNHPFGHLDKTDDFPEGMPRSVNAILAQKSVSRDNFFSNHSCLIFFCTNPVDRSMNFCSPYPSSEGRACRT